MNQKIRAIIVDDEPPARKRLSALLAECAQIDLLGFAGDVSSAAELCEKTDPDLIFLDIQLPRKDGFALLPLLKGHPKIIFVTAFDRYAVRAFEVNALDYLLKPITAARLHASLLRIESQADVSDHKNLLDTDLVALREDSHLQMVPVRDISFISSEDNYTKVHLVDGSSLMVRKPMMDWENQLPTEHFARVDRSLIVRLDAVRELQSVTRNRSHILFSGNTNPLVLGRRASLRLRRCLSKQ